MHSLEDYLSLDVLLSTMAEPSLQVTGEALIQRSDDTEAALKKRLDVYHKQTSPLVDYYAKRGLLTTLSAEQKAEAVYAKIQESLKKGKM